MEKTPEAILAEEAGIGNAREVNEISTEDIAELEARIKNAKLSKEAKTKAEAEMKKLGKTYEPHVFEGAGHGFLRAQDDRNGANLKATQQAWPRTVAFLREHLK